MIESIGTLFLDSGGPKLAYDIRPGVGPVLLCVHGNSSHRGHVEGGREDSMFDVDSARRTQRRDVAVYGGINGAESAECPAEGDRRRRAFPDVGETGGSGE